LYADKIGERYHFPKKYYNLLTLPDIEFIYYEPKKRGEGVYFGYGEVGKVDPDPENPDQFFAEILNFRQFPNMVEWTGGDGKNREPELASMGQLAVRQIASEIFEKICEDGGLELASLGVDNENPDSTDRNEVLFDPSKIKVDREAMSVFQVLRKISLGELKLNPDFQRNLVWDSLKRCRLIETDFGMISATSSLFEDHNQLNILKLDSEQTAELRNASCPARPLRSRIEHSTTRLSDSSRTRSREISQNWQVSECR